MSEEPSFESNYKLQHQPKHVEILNSLKKIVQHYNFKMVNTDFLQTWDKSEEEIKAVVLLSQLLQRLYNAGVSLKVWQSGLAVAIFRDQSTRTRFSWCSAANMLGLMPQDFDEKKSQIAHGETTRETANMISFCTEVVGIRDDLFVGQGHSYEVEFGTALDNGFKEGCLNQRTTVINLQSDTDHPTQSLSDLIHLKEFFGDSFEDLKGKKIAVSWGYSPSYGKPLSVPQGLIGLLTRFGMDVTLAHPEGFELLPEIVDIASRQSIASGGSFKVTHDMNEAVAGAHVVYCKSWGSLDLMKKRSEMIAQGKASDESLKIAEKEALKESEKFQNWEYNEEKQKLTDQGNALYMHCLPADISGDNCKTGEVSKGVFAANRIAMYKEARNKPFVIASMMMLSRIENVVPALESFVESPTKRSIYGK